MDTLFTASFTMDTPMKGMDTPMKGMDTASTIEGLVAVTMRLDENAPFKLTDKRNQETLWDALPPSTMAREEFDGCMANGDSWDSLITKMYLDATTRSLCTALTQIGTHEAKEVKFMLNESRVSCLFFPYAPPAPVAPIIPVIPSDPVKPKSIEEILKGVEDDPCSVDGLTCAVCMERQRKCLILPCKHLCLCVTCTKALPKGAPCPLCRGKIDDVTVVMM